MKNVESTFQSNIIAYIGLAKCVPCPLLRVGRRAHHRTVSRRAALPHMKRGDCIINTTSVTAYKGSAGMLDYVSLPM